MKPYTMVLPSTALFGSSFGSMFLKTIGNSNASLLLILVFAFVITYSIGYLFMRRPQSCPVEAAANTSRKETSNIKEESQPLLDESEEQDTSTSDSNNEDPD
ncbi:uncharacterized protein ISCGN_026297 [Ixodes scapularis]